MGATVVSCAAVIALLVRGRGGARGEGEEAQAKP